MIKVSARKEFLLFENELRNMVNDKLRNLDYIVQENGEIYSPKHNSKDEIRKLHEKARNLELDKRKENLTKRFPLYKPYFARGEDIKPEEISPKLIEVVSHKQHELFKIARLIWSLPFSKGFGRRLRFLILDKSNNKLIGILALQSPPLSFPARDILFTYPENKKTELINQTMDIQTLGAIPPYNRLLGGKLVALAAASNEVRKAYHKKYKDKITEMERRKIPPHLVALTTTSAFGRSSIYNRLYLSHNPTTGEEKKIVIAESLGYTVGYGSFHLMELYNYFREYLEAQGISTYGGFGTGPRRKWQTMVKALNRLGFSGKILKHGVKREAFIFPLIFNLDEYMEGSNSVPSFVNYKFKDLAEYWKNRWLIPRSERVDGWHRWKVEEIEKSLKIYRGDCK